jgi:hypothetical protein
VRRTQRDRLCTVFVSYVKWSSTRTDACFDSLFFKAAFIPSLILFCSECKWFGGVIAIKSVDTVAHIYQCFGYHTRQDIKTHKSEHWSVKIRNSTFAVSSTSRRFEPPRSCTRFLAGPEMSIPTLTLPICARAENPHARAQAWTR